MTTIVRSYQYLLIDKMFGAIKEVDSTVYFNHYASYCKARIEADNLIITLPSETVCDWAKGRSETGEELIRIKITGDLKTDVKRIYHESGLSLDMPSFE